MKFYTWEVDKLIPFVDCNLWVFILHGRPSRLLASRWKLPPSHSAEYGELVRDFLGQTLRERHYRPRRLPRPPP